jgi:hypothetical protein
MRYQAKVFCYSLDILFEVSEHIRHNGSERAYKVAIQSAKVIFASNENPNFTTFSRPRLAMSTQAKAAPYTFNVFFYASELIEHWDSVRGRTVVVNLSNIGFASEFRDIPDLLVPANGGEVRSQSTGELFDINTKGVRA